jgi:hypothetical protein
LIYLFTDDNFFKIGISENPNKRVKQLQTGNGSRLRIVKTFENPSKIYSERLMERRLHFFLRQFKKTGEWFEFREMNKDQVIALIEKMLLL